jgi:hypothetical protein
MPIVGNHEISVKELSRYLNSTWEGWAPLDTLTMHAAGNAHGMARRRRTRHATSRPTSAWCISSRWT